MKYAFIKQNKDEYSISLMCQVFSVSRSGYYGWVNRKPSLRELKNKDLDSKIILTFSKHKGRYGSPRITRELKKEGVNCSFNRVSRRMRLLNLKALAKKKFKVTTDSEHSKPIFENILNRDFSTTDINQKWAGDISVPQQAA